MDDMTNMWIFEQMFPGELTGRVYCECDDCQISWEQDADEDDDLYECPQCGNWVEGKSVI